LTLLEDLDTEVQDEAAKYPNAAKRVNKIGVSG
jgi:hypothetical protein